MIRYKIPFNRPLILGNENENLDKVFINDKFSGNGEFTKLCTNFLEESYQCKKVIITSSCTDALEMAALLCNLEPGDEVIMPSYTYVSKAIAFGLRRVKIVWCDIREDTKNIDETKIEDLITSKTRSIVVAQYKILGDLQQSAVKFYLKRKIIPDASDDKNQK